MHSSSGIQAVRQWFASCGWTPSRAQEEVWRAVAAGSNGVLQSPTGSGKTTALLFAALIQSMDDPPADEHRAGLRLLWILPDRARASDLAERVRESAEIFDINWSVVVRRGDNRAGVGKRRHRPHVLVTTPENLHVLFSESGYSRVFHPLRLVVVDEWHEFAGTTTGVLTELALARLQRIAPDALVWWSSAGGDTGVLRGFSSGAARTVVVRGEEHVYEDLSPDFSDSRDRHEDVEHKDIFTLVEDLACATSAVRMQPHRAVPAFDVLVQYCLTLACSDGFTANTLYREVAATPAFRQMSREEFDWVIGFLVRHPALRMSGGSPAVENDGGVYRIANPAVALQLRMQIGTRGEHGAGGYRATAQCIAVAGPEGVVATPQWAEEMCVSPEVARTVRQIIGEMASGAGCGEKTDGIFAVQQELSAIPDSGELLVESVVTPGRHYLFLYPFEGRLAHKNLAVLLAWRIIRHQPTTIRMAVHDYGIALLADNRIPIGLVTHAELLSGYGLHRNMPDEIAIDEPARRRFRDIARIAVVCSTGEIEQEQAAADRIFDMWKQSDRTNLLLRQAYDEVRAQFMSEERLRAVLDVLAERQLVITHLRRFSPFALSLCASL